MRFLYTPIDPISPSEWKTKREPAAFESGFFSSRYSRNTKQTILKKVSRLHRTPAVTPRALKHSHEEETGWKWSYKQLYGIPPPPHKTPNYASLLTLMKCFLFIFFLKTSNLWKSPPLVLPKNKSKVYFQLNEGGSVPGKNLRRLSMSLPVAGFATDKTIYCTMTLLCCIHYILPAIC